MNNGPLSNGPRFGFVIEYVDDIEAARHFYEGVLGLEVQRTHPTFVQFDHFAIAADEPMAGGGEREVYWLVDDAESAFDALSRAAEIVLPLRQVPFGRVFSFCRSTCSVVLCCANARSWSRSSTTTCARWSRRCSPRWTLHRGRGWRLRKSGGGNVSAFIDVDDLRVALVNPRIVAQRGRQRQEDGCLSLPGISAVVERAADVVVEAQDLDGIAFQLEASDALSFCLQHELDHLGGRLYFDHLSLLRRRAVLEAWEREKGRYPDGRWQVTLRRAHRR